MISAAQLEGSFDGVTASMSSPTVQMRTFRDQSQYINDKQLRAPGDSKFTLVEFPTNFTTGLHTKHQSHDLGLSATESIVVRVVTVGADYHNGFNYLSPIVTSVTNEDNDDVTTTTTPGGRGGLDLGLIEIASAVTQVMMIRTTDLVAGTTTTEKDLALTVEGLDQNDRITVTMPGTIEGGFDRDFDSWLRYGACHGAHQTLTFDCPQGDVDYPCPGDWLIDYRCPGIVPSCLYWDEVLLPVSPARVSCSCLDAPYTLRDMNFRHLRLRLSASQRLQPV